MALPGVSCDDYALGIGLLVAVVLLWTASNFVTQGLFEGGYEKPFAVTYLNTSAFVIYLVPYFFRERWVPRARRMGAAGVGEVLVCDGPLGGRLLAESEPPVEDETSDEVEMAGRRFQPHSEPPLDVNDTANLAFVFCFLWFIANWSVNASLEYTSVASATILTSMSGFSTLAIGHLFHVEKLTAMKAAAVVVSFLGVVLVSISDFSMGKATVDDSARPTNALRLLIAQAEAHAQRPILGDVLALISALFYSIYVILLKVRIKSEARIDMQLFLGFVGLFNVLMCWPMGVLLHLLGVERFGWPVTKDAWMAIAVNMVITLTSDYLYVLAMLKTTPLVVTVGLSLTIPVAVFGDYVLQRPTQGQVMLGAVLVLASFIAVGVLNDEKDERKCENLVPPVE